MKISEIDIGERHRKDLGDIEELAESIEEVGLLQPVTVEKESNTLIDGYRRIEAFKLLGKEDIPARKISIDNIIAGEYHANVFRKDFTPLELADIGRKLEPELREKARKRQTRGSGNFPEGEKGQVRDQVGDFFGVSGKTYEKTKFVAAAAKENPEKFEETANRMDAGDISIDRAYRQVKKEKEKEKREEKARKLPKPPALDRGELPLNEVICGDCIDVMNQLPENSVHMVMFSPGYWGLRDYGMDSVVWGGDPDCDHDFEIRERKTTQGGDPGATAQVGATKAGVQRGVIEEGFCSKCGAWKGQLGLEPDYRMYIEHLVEVGRAIKRVLRPDGSWYLNLGDTYSGSGGSAGHTPETKNLGRKTFEYGAFPTAAIARDIDIPAKCKMLMPHRVALALIDDGWICRNDIVWYKPNPMPSSVRDRLNTTYEFVFHLVQQEEYYYDLDAIREEPKATSPADPERYERKKAETGSFHDHSHDREQGWSQEKKEEYEKMTHPRGKNPGDLWEITTQPFPDAHFAVYPEELCKRPIKSSCPPKVCARCGSPYERVTETEKIPDHPERGQSHITELTGERSNKTLRRDEGVKGYEQKYNTIHRSKGWKKTCGCETDETKPGIVLDPMAGSGTTGLAAKKLGRDFVLIDINPDYVEMAEKRIWEV